MRYINKTNRCEPFDNFVAQYKGRLRNDWEKFKKIKGGQDTRLKLHQHLWRDQKGLCGYCEQEVPQKTTPEEELKSHFEHIKPQKHFPNFTYAFENIVISCEGFDLTTTPEIKREFCGHFKDKGANYYDNLLFLNPTEIKDIESYFSYDSEGQISPNLFRTDNEQNQAAYMIKTLGLDNPILNLMRKTQYDIWLEKQAEWSEDQLVLELSENQLLLPAFYSLLKQKIL
jgi:uncharacterized protein (TIGR02646 family)